MKTTSRAQSRGRGGQSRTQSARPTKLHNKKTNKFKPKPKVRHKDGAVTSVTRKGSAVSSSSSSSGQSSSSSSPSKRTTSISSNDSPIKTPPALGSTTRKTSGRSPARATSTSVGSFGKSTGRSPIVNKGRGKALYAEETRNSRSRDASGARSGTINHTKHKEEKGAKINGDATLGSPNKLIPSKSPVLQSAKTIDNKGEKNNTKESKEDKKKRGNKSEESGANINCDTQESRKSGRKRTDSNPFSKLDYKSDSENEVKMKGVKGVNSDSKVNKEKCSEEKEKSLLKRSNRKSLELEPSLKFSDDKKGKNQKNASIGKDLDDICDNELGKKTNKSILSAQSSDNRSLDTSNRIIKKLNNSETIEESEHSSIINKNTKEKCRERLKDKEEKEVRGKTGKMANKSSHKKNTKDHEENLGTPKKKDDKINEDVSDDDHVNKSKDKVTKSPKKGINNKDDEMAKNEDDDESDSENATPRKRGRPKGAKNKKNDEQSLITKESKSSETETEKEDKKPKLNIMNTASSTKKERSVFSFSESDGEKEDFKSLKHERKKIVSAKPKIVKKETESNTENESSDEKVRNKIKALEKTKINSCIKDSTPRGRNSRSMGLKVDSSPEKSEDKKATPSKLDKSNNVESKSENSEESESEESEEEEKSLIISKKLRIDNDEDESETEKQTKLLISKIQMFNRLDLSSDSDLIIGDNDEDDDTWGTVKMRRNLSPGTKRSKRPVSKPKKKGIIKKTGKKAEDDEDSDEEDDEEEETKSKFTPKSRGRSPKSVKNKAPVKKSAKNKKDIESNEEDDEEDTKSKFTPKNRGRSPKSAKNKTATKKSPARKPAKAKGKSAGKKKSQQTDSSSSDDNEEESKSQSDRSPSRDSRKSSITRKGESKRRKKKTIAFNKKTRKKTIETEESDKESDDSESETNKSRKKKTTGKVSSKTVKKPVKGKKKVSPIIDESHGRVRRMASLNAIAMMHVMTEDSRVHNPVVLEPVPAVVAVAAPVPAPASKSMALVLHKSAKPQVSQTDTDETDEDKDRRQTSTKRKNEEEPERKVKKKRKKRRGELDVHMDMRDMVVTKRMASLNASAMMTASYGSESRKRYSHGGANSSSTESEITNVDIKRKISVKSTDDKSSKTRSVITVQETTKKVSKKAPGKNETEVEEHIIVKKKVKRQSTTAAEIPTGVESEHAAEEEEEDKGSDDSELEREMLNKNSVSEMLSNSPVNIESIDRLDLLTKSPNAGEMIVESTMTYITTQSTATSQTVTISGEKSYSVTSGDGKTTTMVKQVQQKSTTTADVPAIAADDESDGIREFTSSPVKAIDYAPLDALSVMQPIMAPATATTIQHHHHHHHHVHHPITPPQQHHHTHALPYHSHHHPPTPHIHGPHPPPTATSPHHHHPQVPHQVVHHPQTTPHPQSPQHPPPSSPHPTQITLHPQSPQYPPPRSPHHPSQSPHYTSPASPHLQPVLHPQSPQHPPPSPQQQPHSPLHPPPSPHHTPTTMHPQSPQHPPPPSHHSQPPQSPYHQAPHSPAQSPLRPQSPQHPPPPMPHHSLPPTPHHHQNIHHPVVNHLHSHHHSQPPTHHPPPHPPAHPAQPYQTVHPSPHIQGYPPTPSLCGSYRTTPSPASPGGKPPGPPGPPVLPGPPGPPGPSRPGYMSPGHPATTTPHSSPKPMMPPASKSSKPNTPIGSPMSSPRPGCEKTIAHHPSMVVSSGGYHPPTATGERHNSAFTAPTPSSNSPATSTHTRPSSQGGSVCCPAESKNVPTGPPTGSGRGPDPTTSATAVTTTTNQKQTSSIHQKQPVVPTTTHQKHPVVPNTSHQKHPVVPTSTHQKHPLVPTSAHQKQAMLPSTQQKQPVLPTTAHYHLQQQQQQLVQRSSQVVAPRGVPHPAPVPASVTTTTNAHSTRMLPHHSTTTAASSASARTGVGAPQRQTLPSTNQSAYGSQSAMGQMQQKQPLINSSVGPKLSPSTSVGPPPTVPASVPPTVVPQSHSNTPSRGLQSVGVSTPQVQQRGLGQLSSTSRVDASSPRHSSAAQPLSNSAGTTKPQSQSAMSSTSVPTMPIAEARARVMGALQRSGSSSPGLNRISSGSINNSATGFNPSRGSNITSPVAGSTIPATKSPLFGLSAGNQTFPGSGSSSRPPSGSLNNTATGFNTSRVSNATPARGATPPLIGQSDGTQTSLGIGSNSRIPSGSINSTSSGFSNNRASNTTPDATGTTTAMQSPILGHSAGNQVLSLGSGSSNRLSGPSISRTNNVTSATADVTATASRSPLPAMSAGTQTSSSGSGSSSNRFQSSSSSYPFQALQAAQAVQAVQAAQASNNALAALKQQFLPELTQAQALSALTTLAAVAAAATVPASPSSSTAPQKPNIGGALNTVGRPANRPTPPPGFTGKIPITTTICSVPPVTSNSSFSTASTLPTTSTVSTTTNMPISSVASTVRYPRSPEVASSMIRNAQPLSNTNSLSNLTSLSNKTLSKDLGDQQISSSSPASILFGNAHNEATNAVRNHDSGKLPTRSHSPLLGRIHSQGTTNSSISRGTSSSVGLNASALLSSLGPSITIGPAAATSPVGSPGPVSRIPSPPISTKANQSSNTSTPPPATNSNYSNQGINLGRSISIGPAVASPTITKATAKTTAKVNTPNANSVYNTSNSQNRLHPSESSLMSSNIAATAAAVASLASMSRNSPLNYNSNSNSMLQASNHQKSMAKNLSSRDLESTKNLTSRENDNTINASMNSLKVVQNSNKPSFNKSESPALLPLASTTIASVTSSPSTAGSRISDSASSFSSNSPNVSSDPVDLSKTSKSKTGAPFNPGSNNIASVNSNSNSISFDKNSISDLPHTSLGKSVQQSSPQRESHALESKVSPTNKGSEVGRKRSDSLSSLDAADTLLLLGNSISPTEGIEPVSWSPMTQLRGKGSASPGGKSPAQKRPRSTSPPHSTPIVDNNLIAPGIALLAKVCSPPTRTDSPDMANAHSRENSSMAKVFKPTNKHKDDEDRLGNVMEESQRSSSRPNTPNSSESLTIPRARTISPVDMSGGASRPGRHLLCQPLPILPTKTATANMNKSRSGSSATSVKSPAAAISSPGANGPHRARIKADRNSSNDLKPNIPVSFLNNSNNVNRAGNGSRRDEKGELMPSPIMPSQGRKRGRPPKRSSDGSSSPTSHLSPSLSPASSHTTSHRSSSRTTPQSPRASSASCPRNSFSSPSPKHSKSPRTPKSKSLDFRRSLPNLSKIATSPEKEPRRRRMSLQVDQPVSPSKLRLRSNSQDSLKKDPHKSVSTQHTKSQRDTKQKSPVNSKNKSPSKSSNESKPKIKDIKSKSPKEAKSVDNKLKSSKENKQKVNTDLKNKLQHSPKSKTSKDFRNKNENKSKTPIESKRKDCKPKPQLFAKLKTQVDPKSKSNLDTKLKVPLDTKPKLQLDLKSKSKQESKVKPHLDTKIKTKLEAKLKLETKIKAALDTKYKPNYEADVKPPIEDVLKLIALKAELSPKIKKEIVSPKLQSKTLSSSKFDKLLPKSLTKFVNGDPDIPLKGIPPTVKKCEFESPKIIKTEKKALRSPSLENKLSPKPSTTVSKKSVDEKKPNLKRRSDESTSKSPLKSPASKSIIATPLHKAKSTSPAFKTNKISILAKRSSPPNGKLNKVKKQNRKKSLLAYLKERSNESDASSVDSEAGSRKKTKGKDESQNDTTASPTKEPGKIVSPFSAISSVGSSTGVNSRKPRHISEPVKLKPPKKPRWIHNWKWEGEPFEGKVWLTNDEVPLTRYCYKAMRHKQGDIVRVRDCVLLRSGPRKTDLPFVAKVAHLWEDPETGDMMMSILWYYRPEHTEYGCRLGDMADEIFASKHRDHLSVACIEDRCYVLTINEYCRYRRFLRLFQEGVRPTVTPVPDPEEGYSRKDRQPPGCVVPELLFFCRRVYDHRLKRCLKNPF